MTRKPDAPPLLEHLKTLHKDANTENKIKEDIY